jgi:Tfp pilus assembly protein PilW
VVAFVLGMVAMLILLLLLGATITFHFKGKEVTLSKEKIEKQLKEER